MEQFLNGIIDICYGIVCHQQEGLLLETDGVNFQVCSRCAGMYLGLGVSYASLLLLRISRINKYPNVLINIVLLSLMSSMVLEWIFVRSGFLEIDNLRRFVTGALFGTGGSVYFQVFWNRQRWHSEMFAFEMTPKWLSLQIMCTFLLIYILFAISSVILIMTALVTSFLVFWVRVNFLVFFRLYPSYFGVSMIRGLFIAVLILVMEIGVIESLISGL